MRHWKWTATPVPETYKCMSSLSLQVLTKATWTYPSTFAPSTKKHSDEVLAHIGFLTKMQFEYSKNTTHYMNTSVCYDNNSFHYVTGVASSKDLWEPIAAAFPPPLLKFLCYMESVNDKYALFTVVAAASLFHAKGTIAHLVLGKDHIKSCVKALGGEKHLKSLGTWVPNNCKFFFSFHFFFSFLITLHR